jgi:hypothetical protein
LLLNVKSRTQQLTNFGHFCPTSYHIDQKLYKTKLFALYDGGGGWGTSPFSFSKNLPILNLQHLTVLFLMREHIARAYRLGAQKNGKALISLDYELSVGICVDDPPTILKVAKQVAFGYFFIFAIAIASVGRRSPRFFA